MTAPGTTATPLTLADLARESAADLRGRYAAAPRPTDLAALDGDLKGRVLAASALRRTVGRALRSLSARPGFLWQGKRFASRDAGAGEGFNRVRGLGLVRSSQFPFSTRIDASALDGDPAVVLDYERAENPAVIRRIHDEVREVSPGVWVGPSMWKDARGGRVLFWFGLARPPGA